MADTVVIARYADKEQYFELPLKEDVMKMTLIGIFGGHIAEPIYVFYQKEKLAELILEDSYFTPQKPGIYLVARAQELRDKPNTVEAFKSGVRAVEGPKEFPFVSSLTNRLIYNVLKKMNIDSWKKSAVTCNRLKEIATEQRPALDGRLRAVSITADVRYDITRDLVYFVLTKSAGPTAPQTEEDLNAVIATEPKSVLTIQNSWWIWHLHSRHFDRSFRFERDRHRNWRHFWDPADDELNFGDYFRQLGYGLEEDRRFLEERRRCNQVYRMARGLNQEEDGDDDPAAEKRFTITEFQQLLRRYRFDQLTLDYCSESRSFGRDLMAQVHAPRLHFSRLFEKSLHRSNREEHLANILITTRCTELSKQSVQFVSGRGDIRRAFADRFQQLREDE